MSGRDKTNGPVRRRRRTRFVSSFEVGVFVVPLFVPPVNPVWIVVGVSPRSEEGAWPRPILEIREVRPPDYIPVPILVEFIQRQDDAVVARRRIPDAAKVHERDVLVEVSALERWLVKNHLAHFRAV